MKGFVFVLSVLLLVIGSFSTIIGVGYGLYELANGVEFAQAAWSGFKFYTCGLITYIIGGIGILIPIINQ